jgi:hypothetical protein
VQFLVIRATTKNTDISKELKDFADKLKRNFKFTGFKLEKTTVEKTEIGKELSVKLLGDYSIKITPRKREKDKGKDRVSLAVEILRKQESKLTANVTLALGETQFFGPQSLPDGDSLIVGVSAK